MQKTLFQTLLIAALITPNMLAAKKGPCEKTGATTETQCRCTKEKPTAGKIETCMKCGSDWTHPEHLICPCVKQGSKYWTQICGEPKETTSKTGESSN